MSLTPLAAARRHAPTEAPKAGAVGTDAAARLPAPGITRLPLHCPAPAVAQSLDACSRTHPRYHGLCRSMSRLEVRTGPSVERRYPGAPLRCPRCARQLHWLSSPALLETGAPARNPARSPALAGLRPQPQPVSGSQPGKPVPSPSCGIDAAPLCGGALVQSGAQGATSCHAAEPHMPGGKDLTGVRCRQRQAPHVAEPF